MQEMECCEDEEVCAYRLYCMNEVWLVKSGQRPWKSFQTMVDHIIIYCRRQINTYVTTDHLELSPVFILALLHQILANIVAILQSGREEMLQRQTVPKPHTTLCWRRAGAACLI